MTTEQTLIAAGAPDLVAAVDDLWLSLAPDPELAGATAPVQASQTLSVSGISAGSTVSIAGTWNGHLVVVCSRAAAERWARSMLAIPEPDPVSGADIDDTVAEIANVLGGAAKASLAGGGQLGLPETLPLPVDEEHHAAAIERVVAVATFEWLDEDDAMFGVALLTA